MPTDKRPILCLDFDGVIHSYGSGWRGAAIIPDPPVPGAIEFLRAAAGEFCVHVYSSRSHQEGGIQAMEAYISAAVAEVIDTWPKDELTDPRLTGMEAAEAWVRAWITFPTHKPPASVSIDDRCITFRGEWPPLEVLKDFRPWNKRQLTKRQGDRRFIVMELAHTSEERRVGKERRGG